jgi:hypothetical protein
VAGVPTPETTEVHLEVGESKIRKFATKRPLNAIAELIWNGLDANAHNVVVKLQRTATDAIEEILVSDDGDGFSLTQAQTSFREYGETWKANRTHTEGNRRILHGRNGEGPTVCACARISSTVATCNPGG